MLRFCLAVVGYCVASPAVWWVYVICKSTNTLCQELLLKYYANTVNISFYCHSNKLLFYLLILCFPVFVTPSNTGFILFFKSKLHSVKFILAKERVNINHLTRSIWKYIVFMSTKLLFHFFGVTRTTFYVCYFKKWTHNFKHFLKTIFIYLLFFKLNTRNMLRFFSPTVTSLVNHTHRTSHHHKCDVAEPQIMHIGWSLVTIFSEYFTTRIKKIHKKQQQITDTPPPIQLEILIKNWQDNNTVPNMEIQ